jgi:putative ABC transport system permease protein
MTVRIYRALLLLLPGWFREEFSGEMTAVFRDSLADARREGAAPVTLLWIRTIGDLASLGWRLHAEATRQDVSYAIRTLRRTPAFTGAAIATLALGMGPTVVIANLLQRVVLQPLPFPESDRLVSVWNAQPDKDRHEVPLSAPDYVDFRDQRTAFEALAAHTGTSVAFVGAGEPRQVAGVLTTSEMFRVLGIQPIHGRALTPADSAPGALPVIVLGSDFWRSEFGGRADIVGQTVKIDGRPTAIVGVLPDGLDFPTGSRSLWVPLTLDPTTFNRGSHFLSATGRLAPGVTISQASDMLNGVARALAERYPGTNAGSLVEIVDLKQQLNGDAPRLLTVLSAAIAAVLLIACTNVASLLTVRASVRGSELAVRTAIGATVRRLRRQLLVEHLLLAVCGGALAAAIAVPVHRVLVESRLLSLPRTAAPTVGWEAFAVLGVVVMLIGTAFARITARRSAADSSASALLSSGRQTGVRSQLRLRQSLVVIEVAGALVLVVVAGLMIRSAARLANVDPGFRTDSVLTFGVVLPGAEYREAASRLQFVNRVVEKLRELPAVRAAAAAGYAPMGQMRNTRRYAPEDRPRPQPGAEPLAVDLPVSSQYFEVMGIRLLEGRVFDNRDHATATPVLIVSETFARDVFPGERAVGKRIGYFSSRPGGVPPPPREIVGVVSDVRQDGVSRRPMSQMYAPYAQSAWGFASFFVRVDGNPDLVAPSLQRVVSSVDPMRPVRDVKPTGDIVRASTARERAMTAMLIALAVIALLLATIGLYGVSATAAAARSRELAIRAAVGAHPVALVRLVLFQGLATGAAGVALGAAASLAATRGLGALLYETPPRDPATFAATSMLLLGIAAIATYIPARRALATNPAEVLRTE